MAKPEIIEKRRLRSPAVTPQALAWDGKHLWMGSRDLLRIYKIDVEKWTVAHETDAPGIPWAAVSTGDGLRFTIGEGPEDDRYLRSYDPESGFGEDRIACPEFTGSYLSYDGEHLYLSQWYKHRILKLDAGGKIVRVIDVGAEICGHVFVDGTIYVLRGTEQPTKEWQDSQKTPNAQRPTPNVKVRSGAERGSEYWCIARLDQRKETPEVEDLARVPFACRSLTFDGANFWTNHRAANEIVSFILPE